MRLNKRTMGVLFRGWEGGVGVKTGSFIRIFVCILILTICDTTDSISTYYGYSYFKTWSFISYTLVVPPPNLGGASKTCPQSKDSTEKTPAIDHLTG